MKMLEGLDPVIVAAGVFASLNVLAVLAVGVLGRARKTAAPAMRATEAPAEAMAGDMLDALVQEVEATESRHWSARGEMRLAEDLKRWRDGGTDRPHAAETRRGRSRFASPRSVA